MRKEIKRLNEQQNENERRKEREVNDEYTVQNIDLFIKTRIEYREKLTRHKNEAE
jgi:hypothetical protein